MVDGTLRVIEGPARGEQESHEAKRKKDEQTSHIEKECHGKHSAKDTENIRIHQESQVDEMSHASRVGQRGLIEEDRNALPNHDRERDAHQSHLPSGMPDNLAVEFHWGEISANTFSDSSSRESVNGDSHLDQLQTIFQEFLPFLRLSSLEEVKE